MTNSKDDKLSLEDVNLDDVKSILENQVASGAILSSCPTCKSYLSFKEYCTKRCNICKKEINFNDILYYPGAKKENN